MPPFENSNQVELRNILLEPKAQSELGKFAREIEKLNYLMCWVDVEEFKHTSSYDLRRVCGLKIVHNYVKETSPLYIKIDEQEAKMYQSVLYLPASVAAPPILIDDEEDPASVSFYAGRPVQNIPLSLFENVSSIFSFFYFIFFFSDYIIISEASENVFLGAVQRRVPTFQEDRLLR